MLITIVLSLNAMTRSLLVIQSNPWTPAELVGEAMVWRILLLLKHHKFTKPFGAKEEKEKTKKKKKNPIKAGKRLIHSCKKIVLMQYVL